MSSERTFPIGTLVLALVWLSVMVIAYLWWRPGAQQIPAELKTTLWPQPQSLQPFELLDQHQAIFSEERLRENWSFVFFGYTHCPDICPTSLLTLKQVSNLLADDPDVPSNVQFVFISVDPDRDTPEDLKKYIAYFDEDFIGVTGAKREIDQVASQFGAGYVKESESDRDTYLISHTASFFLVDPEARIIGGFSPPHDPGDIASRFEEVLELY